MGAKEKRNLGVIREGQISSKFGTAEWKKEKKKISLLGRKEKKRYAKTWRKTEEDQLGAKDYHEKKEKTGKRRT